MQTDSATAMNAVSRTIGAPAARPVADYDSFLQLLVTQMRNQDPTKPMDPTQTVTQLATFASVEQAIKTNSLLSAMVVNSSLSQAAAMIGKTITPPDGSTGGVVKSVTISDMGLVATLTDGRSVLLTPGVTIS